MVVTEAKPIPGGERDMLGFETLTLAPLDKKLIVPGLLTEQEWLWIDRYHARAGGSGPAAGRGRSRLARRGVQTALAAQPLG